MNRRSIIMAVGTAVIVLAVAAGAAASSGMPSPDQRGTAYLGVHIDDLTPQQAAGLKVNESGGAVIADVDQDGPACRAGLKENDVIVGFNGAKVENSEQLGSLIHATAPGRTVSLTVVRNGEKKDIKVTLGTWPRAMARMQTFNSGNTGAPMAFPGPIHPIVPDIEIPSFTTLSSRHGMVVETLCPQLSEYFGVPSGRGVLVRSVEGGSPAAAAGLKAGDVILRVNNEQIHDIADWRRGMGMNASKISILILRDKREQTLVMNVPAPGSSQLEEQNFEKEMQSLREELQKMSPEIAQAQKDALRSVPSQQEMRKQIQEAMKLKQKDLEEMQREWTKSVGPTPEQMEETKRQIQESIPSAQDLEKMRQEIEKSMQEFRQQWEQQQPY